MKRLFSICIVFLCFSPLFAQKRTLEQAKKAACEYLSQTQDGTAKAISGERLICSRSNNLQKIVGIEDSPFFILRDSLSPSSYIIVSGDERMKTVLAIGDKGRWDEDNIPDGLLFLLDCYCQQYMMLQSGEASKVLTASPITIPDVSPMLKTTWQQTTPYNALCPNDCPSGCVATAMSQVMKYHQYPSSGNGSFSYTSRTRKYNCSYNFSTANFKWNQMKSSYGDLGVGSEEKDVIAQATYACGVSVGMDYDKSGSGAYLSDVPYAMINFFNYNKNVSFRDRGYYNSSEWYQMLCKELSSGRPVIYGGVDSKNGGHAFVIDGCNSKTKKFHVNWGWGGSFDDYYELDALDPQTYMFSSYQDMVIYVSPETVGSFEDVFYAGSFSLSNKISAGKDITFTISDVYCYASQSSYVVTDAKFYGTIGVGVFDQDFNFLHSLGSDFIDGLNNFYGYTKVTYNAIIDKSLFPKDGTYYIAPYVQEKDSKHPTRIRTSGGKSDYVLVTVDKNNINGEEDNEEPVEIVSEWSEDFESTTIPKAWKQEKELGKGEWMVRYVLMASDEIPAAAHGRGYAYINYATGLDLYNSRTVTRLITPVIALTNGKYNLSFQYRKHSSLPESTDILTVYYKKGNEWVPLDEIAVTNQGEWRWSTIELPVTSNLEIAFEGSPARGSSLYLDNINIYDRNAVPSLITENQLNDPEELYKIYTVAGIFVGSKRLSDVNKLQLRQGIYILLSSNNKVSKIYIK